MPYFNIGDAVRVKFNTIEHGWQAGETGKIIGFKKSRPTTFDDSAIIKTATSRIIDFTENLEKLA